MDLKQIRSGLEKPGKSKRGLAAALGRQPSMVTALLRGERQLKASEIPVVERYLELSADTTVPLVGYVGAGAEAFFFADQGEIDRVPAPEGATESTVAVEIRGESLGSFFDRWIVYYDQVRRPVTPDLLGRLCIVGLEDGRILVKKLQRSKARGLFHLLSQTEGPILDVAVDWAAPVKLMAPR